MNPDLICPQCNKQFKTKGGRSNHIKKNICQPKIQQPPNIQVPQQQLNQDFPNRQYNEQRDKFVPYEKTDEEESINLLDLSPYNLRIIILRQQCSIRKLQSIIAELQLEVHNRSRESYAFLQKSILEIIKDPELLQKIVFSDNKENKIDE